VTVARKLTLALGLHLLLLTGLLVHHVRTIRGAVGAAHELSDLSARVVLVSSRQSTRLTQLEENAAKYAVTRDLGYRDKFSQLMTDFAVDLEQLDALELAGGERGALAALVADWQLVRPVGAAFAAAPRVTSADLERVHRGVGTLHAGLERLADASRVAMRDRLATSAAAAERAAQLSWLAAALALLLAIGTAIGLMRAITEPLQRLIAGTRAVADGRFEHRLAANGEDEFAQVGRAFNSMAERLAALDRMKQDFVSTVSHDLKSPLASMRESTTVLLDGVAGPLTDAQRRVLELQQESADRLGRMIAKLLDLSRLEHGLVVTPREIALQLFLERVTVHAQTAAREREVSVRLVHVGPPNLTLNADEDALHALLDNLLENAIKFSPRGATVELSASVHDAAVCLIVEDRGPGVPAEDRERIFGRFQQTATGRNVPGRGVGLGLTICREIARAHHGRVRVTDRDGGGSRFIVELPLSTNADNATAPAARGSAKPRGAQEVAA
jgi:signal transduction histidine kinase